MPITAKAMYQSSHWFRPELSSFMFPLLSGLPDEKESGQGFLLLNIQHKVERIDGFDTAQRTR